MTRMILFACSAVLVLIGVAACNDEVVAPVSGGANKSLKAGVGPSVDSRFVRGRALLLDVPNDEPFGRGSGEEIDIASIRLFKAVSGGPLGPDEILHMALYVDDLGYRAWDEIDFFEPDAVCSRMEEIRDFKVIVAEGGRVVAVDLGRRFPPRAVIGATYVVVDMEGNRYRVGDDPGLGPPSQEIPGQAGVYYRLKRLEVRFRPPG